MKSLVTTMFSNIDGDLGEQKVFKTIKDKTGLTASKVCLGVVALICLLAILDIAADLITTLFGMVYPAYMSFKVSLPPCRPLKRKATSRRRSG